MKIQKTEWGQIEWISYTTGQENALGSMNVGIVTVEPGKVEPHHVHYDDQMLYVLEGEAICYIDGIYYEMKPGNLFYWPAGVTDEVICKGDKPFRHLLASNPLNPGESMLIEREEEQEDEPLDTQYLVELLYIAVEAIRTQFLEGLHYAYVIFDCQGHLVHRSKYFPTRCMECCSPSILFGASPCMVSPGGTKLGRAKESHACHHGIQLFNTPIFYRRHFLGHVMGGFIWKPQQNERQLYGVYDMPISNIMAIQSLMDRIAKAIRNFCEFDQFRKRLTEKERQLDTHMKAQRDMEENLKNAEYAMIDLKINNHFLFNTLNSMASMALKGGNEELYQSIINLSELFRSSLQIEDKLVTMETEFNYLKSYLELQGIRYRKGLKVSYEVDESLFPFLVPHNFMQPVVENAFVHGFSPDKPKWILVRIHRVGERMEVVLGNSGHVLDERKCMAIKLGMQSGSSHGMSIVYQKLKHIFGEDFIFDVISGEGTGTIMRIVLPIIKEERPDDTSGNLR